MPKDQRWATLEPCDPFEYHRLMSESYSLQNMLIKQAAMPATIALDVDKVLSVYQDRIPNEWRKAAESLPGERSWGDSGFASMSDGDFLAFAQRVADACGEEMKVTGARLIRYTNAASGYPCPLLVAVEVIHAPERRKLLYGQEGTREPEAMRMMRRGGWICG